MTFGEDQRTGAMGAAPPPPTLYYLLYIITPPPPTSRHVSNFPADTAKGRNAQWRRGENSLKKPAQRTLRFCQWGIIAA